MSPSPMDFNASEPYELWIQDIGPARQVATWSDFRACRVVALGRLTRKVPNGPDASKWVYPSHVAIKVKDQTVFEATRDSDGVIKVKKESFP